ncbi:carboxylesterase family protein-like protein [Flagelloscypha sp. PMI_526]|nr:carboxylesterase family protein-like protein [Flagelloscypha sp. PMI_526]
MQTVFRLFCGFLIPCNSFNSGLPVVDLGYGIYQAANITNTTYWTFANIRYAAAPIGDLRWRPPQQPLVNRTVIEASPALDRICPQAFPAWHLDMNKFVKEQLGPDAPELIEPGPVLLDPSQPTPELDPRTDEDCLFLDVYSSKSLHSHSKSAPVLVWIHGGANVEGSKSTGWSHPGGLFEVAEHDLVVVSMNYRLGAFGFLAGSSIRENGTLNLGLLDQQFALRWVQKHIASFGGDPSRVTLMGYSAGGAATMFHMTAYGGQREPLFHQVITQSAGYGLNSLTLQEQQQQLFFKYLSVSTLPDARRASTLDLIRANLPPHWQCKPSWDLRCRYQRGLRVLVGHNFNEGLLFTSPYVNNDSSFVQWFKDIMPTATDEGLQELLDKYPSNFSGSPNLPYTSQITRAALSMGDFVFNCNALAMSSARYHSASYAYLFSVWPALHIADLFYTFYSPSNPNSKRVKDIAAARALQNAIVSFVGKGRPDYGELGQGREYGEKGRIVEFTDEGLREGVDPAMNPRCEWWNAAGLLQH